MYDYFLGGTFNYPADRAAAEATLAHMPDLPAVLRANRAFLLRAVRAVSEAGVRQFLDLGSGIPTAGGVHEVARRSTANAAVVYVDHDPIVVDAGNGILGEDPLATVVHADIRDVDRILTHPATQKVIDLSDPVAVLLVAVLHFVPDSDHPQTIVSQLLDALPGGSHLAISHMSPAERQTPAGMAEAKRRYDQTGNRLYPRTFEQIEELFAGWVLLPPGLVAVPQWRPEPDDEVFANATFPGFAGVARKPGRDSLTPAQRAAALPSSTPASDGPGTRATPTTR